MQRSIDRHEDVIVEYPVCVISVAVLVAVVTRCLFLVVFVKYVLYNRRSTFLFQQTVLIQSFGVCLQISCVVTKDPGTVFGTGTQWFWIGTHDFSKDESLDSP